MTLALAAKPVDVGHPNEERRVARWSMHRYLRDHSVRAGGRQCMDALGASVTVAVGAAGQMHKGGVKRCASLSCPVCGPRIRATRTGEIDTVLGAALEAGCLVFFLTFTLQHKLRDDLDAIWAVLQTSFSAGWSGRRAIGGGYIGQVRVIETTYGANGFHPHGHSALVFEAGTDEQDAVRMIEAVGSRYRQAVRSFGGYVSPGRQGWHVEACRSTSDVSSYLCKIDGRAKGSAGLAMELARGDLKRATGALGRGLSPFELLELAAAGDVRCGELFTVYEQAAKGRHLISISRSLRDRFGVEVKTDEEAAQDDPLSDAVAVYSFTASRWASIVHQGRVGSLETLLYWHHVHGYLLPEWLRVCRIT